MLFFCIVVASAGAGIPAMPVPAVDPVLQAGP